MRRSLLGLALAVVAVSAWGGEARAQFGNANDPINFYYGVYLPRQQAQALQPGPEASIAALNANRQAYAATNRNDAFDTAANRFDVDAGEYGFNGGGRQPGGALPAARIGLNQNGMGPSKYYGGAKLRNFHPGLRSGVSKNANVATIRQRGSGIASAGYGGYGGYGGVGVPGPR